MNKKGAAIVESVMVYPLVILALITAFYILIGLYSQAASMAELHTALRQRAGNASETVMAENFSEAGIEIHQKKGLFYDTAEGKKDESTGVGGLIQVVFQKVYCDQITLTDEEKYIRWSDTATEIIKREV